MSEHSLRLSLWSICLALILGLGTVARSFLGKYEVLAGTVTGIQPAAKISAVQTAESKPALQTTCSSRPNGYAVSGEYLFIPENQS